MGFIVGKKILEKNLVDICNVFYLWWVGGYVYIGMKEMS
jgi:hypothetical protein